MFGFESLEQMYLIASPHFRVRDIPIPVVALNAADDPFCPEAGGCGLCGDALMTVFNKQVFYNFSTGHCIVVPLSLVCGFQVPMGV